jgi:hypothetical protein
MFSWEFKVKAMMPQKTKLAEELAGDLLSITAKLPCASAIDSQVQDA